MTLTFMVHTLIQRHRPKPNPSCTVGFFIRPVGGRGAVVKAVTRVQAREKKLKSWKTRFNERLERMHGEEVSEG